jgi:integrase
LRKGARRLSKPRTIDPADKASIEWLDGLKATTKHGYLFNWSKFLEYTAMSGDQILADRKTDSEHRWERKVLSFKQWLIDKQGLCSNSARSATAAVRGFFTYYYLPIIFRPHERKKINEACRKTEDYRFNKDDLMRMASIGDLTEQYIVVVGKSLGLRVSDFIALTRGNLEPYLNREAPVCIGPLNTRKESVKAYPFLDPDAIPVVKMVLERMTREGRTNPNDRMLNYRREMTLDAIIKRVAQRAGIANGNRIVRFHCLRKFLCDHLASHMSESKWKQIVGKKIGEGAYVGPDSLRQDYIRAMTETTFEKSQPDVEMLAAQRMLEMTLNLAPNIPQAVKERLIAQIRSTKHPTEIKMVESKVKEVLAEFAVNVKVSDSWKKKIIDCNDGKHCQRLVTEQELETLLMQGWHVVVCLPSGKVVVSNEG